MKSTGIVRKVDDLGRIVLPIELRRNLNINIKDSLEIFTSNDRIVLKKYEPSDIFSGEMKELIEYKGKKVSKNSIKELAKLAGFDIIEKDDSSFDFSNENNSNDNNNENLEDEDLEDSE